MAAGELPPVDQRLPAEPLVVRGFDGRVGTYGGTITEYKVWDSAGNAPQLVWTRMPINGYWWSDGHPLTADDFLFPFNDMAMNAELTPRSWPELKVGDATATITKENDYQVRYTFPQAYRFTHINPWFRWYIPNPSFYHEELIQKAVEFDQDKANALRDEIGLDQRGAAVPPAAGTSVSIRTTLQIESGVNGASLTFSAIVSWSTVCASVDDTLVGTGQAGENGIRLENRVMGNDNCMGAKHQPRTRTARATPWV